MMKKYPAALFLSLLLALLGYSTVHAQVIWGSSTGSAWTTPGNWVGGVLPATGQIARFDSFPTSATIGVGINMDTAHSSVSIGAIHITNARDNDIIFGNSANDSAGVLALSGATVNGNSNVILANYAANASQMILQPTQGSGRQTWAIDAGTTSKNITTGGGSSTLAGNTIKLNIPITGSGALTLLGGGTWDATADTGINGGILELNAANAFSAGIIAGTVAGANSGIIALDTNVAFMNATGNYITVNMNSQLMLNGINNATYSYTLSQLNLNGAGNHYTATGRGALINKSGNSYTLNMPIRLASDAVITVKGNSATTMRLSGNISGGGQLIKYGAGNLIISGRGNTYTGTTLINGGTITVDSGSSISNAPLTLAQTDTVAPKVVFNNRSPIITALSSSFTATTGTINQSVTLGDSTILTVNQASNSVFGVGAISTLRSYITGNGAIVKSGAGRLTLTGSGYDFSGGLTLNAGEWRWSTAGSTNINMSACSVTLSTGTLSTIGIGVNTSTAINLGVLTLRDNSSITLDSINRHFIKFAASSTATWVAGKTLTIRNWRGGFNRTAGTKGSLFIGTSATGITASQLSQIRFIDSVGNVFRAFQMSSGEIVPDSASITTTTASYGPFCNNVSNRLTVSFTSAGSFAGSFRVQLSNNSGVFATDTSTNIIGSGNSSPIVATIPAGYSAGTGYRVRVINPRPMTFGTNNGTNIVMNGNPTVSPISGSNYLVVGATSAYSSTTSGGAWSSTDTTIATIMRTTGIATGVTVGTTTLSYTVTNVCSLSTTVSRSINVINGATITQVVPIIAIPGTTITIRGRNFNPNPAQNIISFGGVSTTASSANDSTITVTLPINSTYDKITVTDTATGRMAGASNCFLPTYSNTGLILDSINLKPRIDLRAGATPIGVATADLDGDGRPDVVVCNSGPDNIYVYKNNNNIGIAPDSFSSPLVLSSSNSPYYARIADLDGDGKPEIVAACAGSANKISVYRNISRRDTIAFAGRVDLAFGGSAATDLEIADLDGDNKPEITVVAQGSSKICVLKNNCIKGSINTSSFLAAVQYNTAGAPYKVAIADLDNDAKPDIVVSNAGSNNVTIYHNAATIGSINASSFATTLMVNTGDAPIGVAIADLDSNGKPEIITTNYWGSNITLIKNTNGTPGVLAFDTGINFAANRGCSNIAAGDIDGDGRPDIIVEHYDANTIMIFKNTARTSSATSGWLTRRLEVATLRRPSGIAVSDLDGDKKADILATSGSLAVLSIFKNYPLPPNAPIIGIDSICEGSTTVMRDTVAGGAWKSSDTYLATVSSTGTVTALHSGIDTIIYYTIAQGDTNYAYHRLVIDDNRAVSPITTTASSLCVGALIRLQDSIPTGIWTSSDTTIAIIDSFTGYLRGRSIGNVIITYTKSNTCGRSLDTILLRVIPSSGYRLGDIRGAGNMCAGSSITLTDTSAGGTWLSTDTLIAAITSGTGVLTARLYGTTTISYSLSTTCGLYVDTALIHVDTLLRIDSIEGASYLCPATYTILSNPAPGRGTWSTLHGYIRMSGDTAWAASAGLDTVQYSYTNVCGTVTFNKPIYVAAAPNAGTIAGRSTICVSDTANLSTTGTGGTWRRTNTRATISTSGVVTGITAGLDTILYTVADYCGSDTARYAIRINATYAGIINGGSSVCVGGTLLLSDTLAPGGIWLTTRGRAIVSGMGVVTGVTAGADTILYIATNSCGPDTAIKRITVNAYPVLDTIAGLTDVCVGNTITLTTTDTGGVWSRTNTKATVTAGVVRGVTAGVDTILYIKSNGGCADSAFKVINIISSSTAGTISSASSLCVASTMTLRSTLPGGTWSTTGRYTTLSDSVLTGTAAGSDTVTYTLNTICGIAQSTKKITINPLPFADTIKIKSSSTIYVGDTVQLTNKVPGGVWSMTNANAIVSSKGVVGALQVGLDTVRYAVSNGCGIDTALFEINILTKDAETISNVVIAPNPNTGYFLLRVESSINEEVGVLTSSSVFQIVGYETITTNKDYYYALQVANGIYYISLYTKTGRKTFRIVVNR